MGPGLAWFPLAHDLVYLGPNSFPHSAEHLESCKLSVLVFIYYSRVTESLAPQSRDCSGLKMSSRPLGALGPSPQVPSGNLPELLLPTLKLTLAICHP